MVEVFENWKEKTIPTLKGLQVGIKPKKLIHEISEDLLSEFSNLQLIDRYDADRKMSISLVLSARDSTLLFRANDAVVAVLETRPPKKPVKIAPVRKPKMRLKTDPKT